MSARPPARHSRYGGGAWPTLLLPL